MARKPRKRVALSFSEDHRLAPAFTAAGLGAVPAAADVRALIELGLAARSAGLMSVRAPGGTYQLVQAVSAGALVEPQCTPRPVIVAPAPAANHDEPCLNATPERTAVAGAAQLDRGAGKNVEGSPKGNGEGAVKHRRSPVHDGPGAAQESDRPDGEDDARGDAGNELEIDPETRSLLANALSF